MDTLPDGTLLNLVVTDVVILVAAAGFAVYVLARPAYRVLAPSGTDRVGAGLLLLGAGALVLGGVLPWSEVAGAAEDYPLITDGSAVDTLPGLVAVLGSAVVLVACAAVLLREAEQRRTALCALAVGATWLMIGADSLLVLLGADESLLVYDVVAEPDLGLWLVLAGAAAAVLGVLVALARRAPAAPAPYGPGQQPPAYPVTTVPDRLPDFGEDF